MPALLEEDSTFRVVLSCDKKKDDPPTFIFQAQSTDDFIDIADQYDKLDDIESDGERMRTIKRLLERGLRGWENMSGKVYGQDSVTSFLLIDESMELIQQMLSGNQLNGDDAKN